MNHQTMAISYFALQFVHNPDALSLLLLALYYLEQYGILVDP